MQRNLFNRLETFKVHSPYPPVYDLQILELQNAALDGYKRGPGHVFKVPSYFNLAIRVLLQFIENGFVLQRHFKVTTPLYEDRAQVHHEILIL